MIIFETIQTVKERFTKQEQIKYEDNICDLSFALKDFIEKIHSAFDFHNKLEIKSAAKQTDEIIPKW